MYVYKDLYTILIAPRCWNFAVFVVNEFKKQNKDSSVTILPHHHLYLIQSHLQSHYTHNLVAGRHPQNQNIVIPLHLQKQLGKKRNKLNYLRPILEHRISLIITRVRFLWENLKPVPCYIDWVKVRSIPQGWSLRYSWIDRTFKVNMLFIIILWLFAGL